VIGLENNFSVHLLCPHFQGNMGGGSSNMGTSSMGMGGGMGGSQNQRMSQHGGHSGHGMMGGLSHGIGGSLLCA
jgi:hypothetical protein